MDMDLVIDFLSGGVYLFLLFEVYLVSSDLDRLQDSIVHIFFFLKKFYVPKSWTISL